MTDERARELVEALRELAQRRETYSTEAGQAADEIERLWELWRLELSADEIERLWELWRLELSPRLPDR